MLATRSPARRFPKPFFLRKEEPRPEATAKPDGQKQQEEQQEEPQIDKESDKQSDKQSSKQSSKQPYKPSSLLGPGTPKQAAISVISTASNQEQRELLSSFITANHVLAQRGLLGGCGHVSIRNPEDPGTFIIAGAKPASLVRGQHDMVVLPIGHDGGDEDEEGDGTAAPRSESFIHSEIYRRFPGVQSVVHAPPGPVVALAAAGRPLRPIWHAAGFLGEGAPEFDAWRHHHRAAPPGGKQDLLVSSRQMGEALASTFAPGDGGQEKEEGAKEEEEEEEEEGVQTPARAVVVQRGHGFVSWGSTLEQAVYRAVYTHENARLQLQAESLARGAADGAWVRFLDRAEAADSGDMNDAAAAKCWQDWAAEARASAQFRNDVEPARPSKR
ncbi:hypothetical protein GGTG_06383 [Gaeumannomyces tritici R3-111a-1]|uniref:Class II aldolase/adducin N-terminal domain-containing protein n=1 Tax=Gaeumannomyces tritici (strain R3-111a-1) TaxID=644352 RepID=J3NYN1_GAET3|nr:hypothetical protein GGTG_06383 [Gaeumannomyces tritici R3-111a-1]EJT76464.1 hypothetical protein GGTG_06383 [Gaeumannomyces tritici R3-111a-1]